MGGVRHFSRTREQRCGGSFPDVGALFQRIVLLILVLTFGACTPIYGPDVAQRAATVLMVPVCNKPQELAPEENTWAYAANLDLIGSANAMAFQGAAEKQGRFFTYDPQADPSNSITMPMWHNRSPCGNTGEEGPLEKPSRVQLLAGKILPPAPPPPCKLLRERALALFDAPEERLRAANGDSVLSGTAPNGLYIAQSAHVSGGGAQMPGAKHPNPVRLEQDQARLKAITLSWDSGNKFGSTIAGIESGLATLSSYCSRFEEDLRENPHILADFQNKIAKTLNDIPLPPRYTEPELKGLAEGAFSQGFEAGVSSKKLQFLLLNSTAVVSVLIFPNVYLATETAAAKSIRLALQRVRSIPIYVPAMTNGAGFFLRIPKPPPANANGPALPAVKPPPISAPPPPPPFGDLSRAAQFGILGETQMAKALVGTGLQRHHLLEQRFIPKMGGDPRMKLSVAVTEAEHQKFTNEWRKKIPYGEEGTFSPRFQRAEIIKAAREIYQQYPAILKALDL